jgi:cytidylate kinase
VAVVTISRQYGAGGLRVASAIADALGFHQAGREVVEEAARRLGMDPGLAQSRDERAPAIVEEIGRALAAGTPPLGGAPILFQDQAPDDRSLAEATRKVIISLADAGGYVILGRGSQAVLGGRGDTCHLCLVGELKDRARAIAEWQHVDESEARDLCRRVDSERAGYLRHFYGVDIANPLLYDCVLNTTRLGIQAAAELAIVVARRKLGLA